MLFCQSGGRVYAPPQRHLQRQRDSCTCATVNRSRRTEAEKAPACKERAQLTLLLGHSLCSGALVELHDDADALLLDAGPMHLAHPLASQRGMAQQVDLLQDALHDIWATANIWQPLDCHLQAEGCSQVGGQVGLTSTPWAGPDRPCHPPAACRTRAPPCSGPHACGSATAAWLARCPSACYST